VQVGCLLYVMSVQSEWFLRYHTVTVTQHLVAAERVECAVSESVFLAVQQHASCRFGEL
jgi:hypothetical protein